MKLYERRVVLVCKAALPSEAEAFANWVEEQMKETLLNLGPDWGLSNCHPDELNDVLARASESAQIEVARGAEGEGR